MGGIRVGLKVSGESCPVVQESISNDSGVREVNKMSLGHDGGVVEEVVFDKEIESANESFEELFSTSDLSIYQFNRTGSRNCACDNIEDIIEHPVSKVQVKNGALFITIHIDEIDDLQTVVDSLEESFESVSVCKIDHSEIKKGENPMRFDRDKLTQRQQEVFRTAYEMGYFKHNNQANASDIADELDIAVSTFSEHMNSIQEKIASEFFKDGEYH